MASNSSFYVYVFKITEIQIRKKSIGKIIGKFSKEEKNTKSSRQNTFVPGSQSLTTLLYFLKYLFKYELFQLLGVFSVLYIITNLVNLLRSSQATDIKNIAKHRRVN